MSSSIHLTNTRGLWFWTICLNGVAYRGASEGFRSAVEAQGHAREALSRYRSLLVSLGH